jgi:hypothetical protein
MPLHSSTAVFRQVLLSPGPFFTDRSPRTGVGFGVVARVAVAHILVVFAGLLLVGVRVATLDASVGIGNAVGAVAGTVVGESIVLGILVSVNWLVVSVVLHAPAKVLHGEGTVGDTLFVVAWSSPVALLLPVATLVALVLAVGDTGSAEAAIRQLDALRGALDGVGALAAFAVLLWQGTIWVAGLKRTHDMPGELAAIAAFVTVCLGLLATLAA